jgi:probable HAF family extracellular repeat protein
MNPRMTNDSGDSVSTVPIYSQPDATHPRVPLGPSSFYAEFTPLNGNAVRIGLPGPDSIDSAAAAINNSDQAVGVSWGSASVSHAFVFTNGQTFDLNQLIPSSPNWMITSAVNIDDQGRILADATIPGSDHTVMLVPDAVPEPSMLAIVSFLLGAAGIRMARRNPAPRLLDFAGGVDRS